MNVQPEPLALHVEMFGGNLFESHLTINKLGMAEYCMSLEYSGGGSSIAVFKAPVSLVKKWRESRRSWCGNHDDLPVAGVEAK